MKKHIITFVIGVLLLGIGCGYFGFEVLSFDYVDEANPSLKQERTSKEYPISEKQTYEFYLQQGELEIVIDNTLLDTMEVTTSYPTDYFELYSNESNASKHCRNLFYTFHEKRTTKLAKRAVDLIINDVSNKTFYNYEKTFAPIVEVRISKDNLKYINQDEEDVWY